MEILKPFSSLTANEADAKEWFRVFSGDVHMIFEGDKFYSNARMHILYNKNNPIFSIDDIRIVSKGRAGRDWKLVYDVYEREYLIARVVESDRLIAGRQTFRGMFGISSDVYVTLDREDYENLRKTLDLPSWEHLIKKQ